MRPDEYIEEVARDFYEAVQDERQLKDQRSRLRDEFFRMADELWRSKDHLLPVQTIEIPQEFFARTGLSQDEFIRTRFPGWDVEHVELNTAQNKRIFVLKRNPRYLTHVVEATWEGDTIQVAKEVSEYSPEVDWETLNKERPDLFKRLAKSKTVYEIDEVELARLFEETPEDAATLKRHLRVKEPTLRATARKVKSDRTKETDPEL